MNNYTTVSGDTFDLIALKLLGDENLAGHIIDENPDFANVIFFGSGVELKVPAQESIPERTAGDIPPWKRDD